MARMRRAMMEAIVVVVGWWAVVAGGAWAGLGWLEGWLVEVEVRWSELGFSGVSYIDD